MLKKLLRLIRPELEASSSASPSGPDPNAWGAPAADAIYDLLFCDRLSAFRPKPQDELAEWQLILFGPDPDPTNVSALAHNSTAESRVRALAFTWLRSHRCEVAQGVVLGVVVEVPLDHGLDVLAAYVDGSVRYINQTGKMVIVEAETLPEANRQGQLLVELAGAVVAQIGTREQSRLPPPRRPNARLTFIVSDGLYISEGPFDSMHQDALVGPIVSYGAQLVGSVVGFALAERGS